MLPILPRNFLYSVRLNFTRFKLGLKEAGGGNIEPCPRPQALNPCSHTSLLYSYDLVQYVLLLSYSSPSHNGGYEVETKCSEGRVVDQIHYARREVPFHFVGFHKHEGVACTWN
ncbi:hypothetical protein VNO77_44750 [Canavalia gladiata]|uniref:Uncharacterized protein n=1 Tax=Canavalia gladiata TaxID=3824 RepID=A0AAN9JYN0_CANGL